MEAFSLLKYWRGGGGVPALRAVPGGDPVGNTRASTIVTALANNAVETDDDDDDDGPFFDLEFAVPDEEEGEDGTTNATNKKEGEKEENNGAVSDHQNEVVVSSDSDDGDDGGREFNFTLSPDSSSNNDQRDPNLSLSPSDDLFFKGRLVPVESSSLDSNKHQFPVASLFKSATKFRVFMLGFKKSKMHAAATNENTADNAAPPPTTTTDSLEKQESVESKESDSVNKQSNSKFFTLKFKIEEVPIVSLFTRENSKNVKTSSSLSQKPTYNVSGEESCAASAGDEKQRFSKDVMQKYLQKVKPLYIRVSKRYGDKLKFSGQLRLKTAVAPPAAGATEQQPESSPAISVAVDAKGAEVTAAAMVKNLVKGQKQGHSLPGGFRVVCKHLGKSRSASSAAVAAAPAVAGPIASRRRDDSLLQQHDGIQSAILHCKRSFNAVRDSESSVLSRSVSDPSHEK